MAEMSGWNDVEDNWCMPTVRHPRSTPPWYIRQAPPPPPLESAPNVRRVHSPGYVPQQFDAHGHPICSKFHPCQSRDCQRCEDRKAHRKAKRLMSRMIAAQSLGRTVMYLTLTRRHRDEGAGQQRTALMESFRALRSTVFWRSVAAGGHAACHLIGNSASVGYNAHIHAIVELLDGVGGMDEDELREAWRRVGGGPVVQARAVPASYRDVQRVGHYITKGMLRQFGERSDDLFEARAATYRKPKVLTFGAWRGRRSQTPTPAEEPVLEPAVEVIEQRETGEVDLDYRCHERKVPALAEHSDAPAFQPSYEWDVEPEQPAQLASQPYVRDTCKAGQPGQPNRRPPDHGNPTSEADHHGHWYTQLNWRRNR